MFLIQIFIQLALISSFPKDSPVHTPPGWTLGDLEDIPSFVSDLSMPVSLYIKVEYVLIFCTVL